MPSSPANPRAAIAAFAFASLAGAQGPGPGSPPDEATVRHVLSRAAYGPTAEALAHVDLHGLDAWIDQNLDAAFPDDDPRLLDALAPLTNLPEEGYPRSPSSRGDISKLQLARGLYSRNQLVEVLTRFWHDHFNVDNEQAWRFYTLTGTFGESESTARYIANYFTWLENRDLRAGALGGFAELLLRSSTDAGMLVYLDGVYSTANNPNENFGRELLELHTLGVGNYQEADVDSAAAVFTGLTIARVDPAMAGDPLADEIDCFDAARFGDLNCDGVVDIGDFLTVQQHFGQSGPPGTPGDVNYDGDVDVQDMVIIQQHFAQPSWILGPYYDESDYVPGTKLFRFDAGTVSFVINPPANPTRAEKYGEIVQLLEHLAMRQATARYVSSKLVAKLVYPIDPDDDYAWPLPIHVLVAQCESTWQSTGGDLRAVVETILDSGAFRNTLAYRGLKAETPLESALSAVRAVESVDLNVGLVTTGAQLELLRDSIEGRSGQPLFTYPPPSGFPEDDPPGSGNLLERMRLVRELYEGDELPVAWSDLLPGVTVGSPELAEAVLALLLGPSGFSPAELTIAEQYRATLALPFADVCEAVATLGGSFPQALSQ